MDGEEGGGPSQKEKKKKKKKKIVEFCEFLRLTAVIGAGRGCRAAGRVRVCFFGGGLA